MYTFISFEDGMFSKSYENIDGVFLFKDIDGVIKHFNHILGTVGSETIYEVLQSQKKTNAIISKVKKLLKQKKVWEAQELFNKNSSIDHVVIYEVESE